MAGVDAGPTRHANGRPVVASSRVVSLIRAAAVARVKVAAADEVERVVVQAAVGDQQVSGLPDDHSGHCAVEVAGVLGEVVLHPELQAS